MITALDTNILSSFWGGPAPIRGAQLDGWRAEGGIVIAGAVYAELAAHPNAGLEILDGLLERSGVAVDFEMGAAVWKLTGSAYAAYAGRRRRSGGGRPKRLLADFIIGAHAQLRADRLATFDRDRYALAFPHLRLLSPG